MASIERDEESLEHTGQRGESLLNVVSNMQGQDQKKQSMETAVWG